MDYEWNARRRKRSPSSSTAGNTSSTSGGEYEVFLSFYGKDTRNTFTDFLYTNLVGAGIRTFRDDDDLRVGEKILPGLLRVIKESKISIPIFSKNYASSKWCLRELSQMVECQKSMGQKIFPIFFGIKPSDVRHQTGIYEQAFRQHEERFDEKTVREWKEALKKVGKLKGFELEIENNGHEEELAREVTSKVLLELKKNNTNAFWKWLFVISNPLIEILGSAFDQVSSPNKPGYALAGLVMSLVAVAVCVTEFLWKARAKNVTWRGWWFYSPRAGLYGSLADIFGLSCAILQVLFSAIQFGFFHQHSDNPIKISIFPIIFALCVSGSKLINNSNDRETEWKK